MNGVRHITSELKAGMNGKNPWGSDASSLTGNSIMTLSVGTYNYNGVVARSAQQYNFTPSSMLKSGVYISPYPFYTTLPSPYYAYEIRPLVYMSQVVIDVPKGYLLENIKVKAPNRDAVSLGETSVDIILSPVAHPTNELFDRYDIDVKSLYEAGKWPYPDDRFIQSVYYDVRATTSAPVGDQTMLLTVYYKNSPDNPTTVSTSASTSMRLSYKGYSASSTTVSKVLVDDKNSLTPVEVTVNNTSPAGIKDVWLYVEGPVSDLSASGLTVVGNYVKVSDQIDVNASKNITLSLKYTGNSSDEVKIHTLSGWDSALDPSGKAITDSSLDNNRGGTSTFTLYMLENRLDAGLKVDKTIFKILDTYTLEAELSSASSPGTIKNPTMDIIVPKGQVFQSAEVIYGTSTYTLTSLSAFTAITDGFTFDPRKVIPDYVSAPSKDLELPGIENTSGTDPNRVILKVTYQVGTSTSMKGMSFSGAANAEGLNTGPITKTGIESKMMYPELDLPYNFGVEMSLNENSFSAQTVNRTLTVKVNLSKMKTGAALQTDDYLELSFPEYLNLVNETSTKPSWDYSGSTLSYDPAKNTVASSKRTIQLPIVSAAYTQMGDEVIYTIPVRYDGNGEESTPLKELNAQVVTLYDTGSGTPEEVTAGNAEALNALFVISDAPVMFADESETLTIKSTGVTGKFWDGSAWSAEASSTTVSPIYTDYDVAAGAEVMQNVEVFYSGGSYGKVDLLYTVYPSLIYTLTPIQFSGCDNYTFQVSDVTVTKNSNHTDVKFYSDAACSSEITASLPFTGNGKVYVRAGNLGGYETTPKEITISVGESVNVTIGSSLTSLTEGSSFTLTATALNAPSGARYHWYKEGIKVHETNSNSWTLLSATLTDTGAYTVLVTNSDDSTTGLCENVSTNSVVVTVLAIPSNVTLSPTAKTLNDCTMPLTVSVDDHIVVFNTGDFTTEEFWWNTSNSTSGAKKMGDNNTVSLSTGLHTIYVWAKNNSGIFSVTPAELSLTINQYTQMIAPAITVSATNVEIPATTGSTGVITISVPTLTGTSGAGGYIYELYDNGVLVGTSGDGRADANTVTKAGNTHDFIVTYDIPAAASKEHKYTVKVTGICNMVTSNEVVVTVYPKAEITLGSTTTVAYCENDATSLGDIGLYTYIQNANSYLTYEYQLNSSGSWTELTSLSMIANESTLGTYTYALRSFNAKGTYSATTPEVMIIVQKKTVITGITGYEVTEGQPINIVVSAEGEGTLSYEWYEGSSLTPFDVTPTNTYQITPSANIASDNGKTFRVVVKGDGVCSEAESTFRLKVNSSSVPPSGNYQVSWNVIGYGKVEVTADGISIRNGSHVNKGTKLMIYATTWKSNILDWVTVNGTTYTSSPITYIVGEVSVDIEASFNGTDPNPDPDSNTEIENGNCIWTEGGYACIYTETASRVRIVTFNGRLVTDQKIGEGESRIQLPDGYYIVTLSDGMTKKIAIRNF